MFNIDRHYKCFDSNLVQRGAYVSNCATTTVFRPYGEMKKKLFSRNYKNINVYQVSETTELLASSSFLVSYILFFYVDHGPKGAQCDYRKCHNKCRKSKTDSGELFLTGYCKVGITCQQVLFTHNAELNHQAGSLLIAK